MKQFIRPKRPGEMPDTARMSKTAKVRSEDIKLKVEVKRNENTTKKSPPRGRFITKAGS